MSNVIRNGQYIREGPDVGPDGRFVGTTEHLAEWNAWFQEQRSKNCKCAGCHHCRKHHATGPCRLCKCPFFL